MIPYSKLSFLIPEYERKKCREREKQITNDCWIENWNQIPSEINTWPKQKTGTKGRPFTIVMRTNPLLALRKAIYKVKIHVVLLHLWNKYTLNRAKSFLKDPFYV